MLYRVVGNRCAIDIESLNLPIPQDKTIQVLEDIGFNLVEVDMIKLARECTKTSLYHRDANFSEAPGVVDCSSFVKWLYAQKGICIPRLSIQQFELGEEVGIDNVIEGDLIFTSGHINYYRNNPEDGVGHVGIVTNNRTVIHAANKKHNIIEVGIDEFIEKLKLRGIRRYIPKDKEIITFEIPSNEEVETSDDIRWIVLRNIYPL